MIEQKNASDATLAEEVVEKNGLGKDTKKIAPKLDPAQFSGEFVEDQNDLFAEFMQTVLDQDKDYPPPVPVINIVQNGEPIPFLTLKSISLWQGKQKSKKTTVLALAVAAFLNGSNEKSGTFFEAATDGVVLFFDTEQGESYAARTMKLILKLAGLDKSPRLIYSDLREKDPTKRFELIKAAISAIPNVKLVVIDGLVDLMVDFMDSLEGHKIATHIMALASSYNIHLAGVLHQNKNDKNARAHIGSIASQKCEIEISTEIDTYDPSRSIVKCVNNRNMRFEDFAIKWEKGALPCIVQDYDARVVKAERDSRGFEDGKAVVAAIFKPLQAYTHKECLDGIMKQTKKGVSTAKTRLKDYLGWGLVAHGADGLYRLCVESGQGSKMGQN